MKSPKSTHVVTTAVAPETLLGGAPFDYADAFEARLDAPDEHSAEQWARAALEDVPLALRWTISFAHRVLLRFRLAPISSKEHVLGWRIVLAEQDVICLEAEGRLMRGVIVGRRVGPANAVMSTFVFYERPVARPIWNVVGALHRAMVPYLLARAATALAARPEPSSGPGARLSRTT